MRCRNKKRGNKGKRLQLEKWVKKLTSTVERQKSKTKIKRLIMEKIKDQFILKLEDRQCSGLTEEKLKFALDTLARFTLQGVWEKLDAKGKILAEDCKITISTQDKAAVLVISISPEREGELGGAVMTVYQDLYGQIDRWGIDKLIEAGKKAYS